MLEPSLPEAGKIATLAMVSMVNGIEVTQMKGIHGRLLALLYLYSPSLSIQTLLAGCLWLGVHSLLASGGHTLCKHPGQVADSKSKHATNCLFMPIVASLH